MHEYEVTYIGTVYNTIKVNARDIPSALEGTQKMLDDEGLAVKVISAKKIHDTPSNRRATVKR